MNGLFQSNLFTSMQGILEALEQLADQWEDSRGDWGKVKKLLGGEVSILLHTRMKGIFSDLYY